jgi:hypothetical protein
MGKRILRLGKVPCVFELPDDVHSAFRPLLVGYVVQQVMQ